MSRIALIGFRGSGKSTVGPLVADELGFRFLDADAELEAAAGRSITEIIQQDGEGAFRMMESHLLARLLDQDRIVLACGGGVVLDPMNRERLKSQALTVWLVASAATCWNRIRHDAHPRPDLTPVGGEQEVWQLMIQRKPLYEAAAHLRVEAELSPRQVADTILQAWRARQGTE